MNVVDANVLLYAVNADASRHAESKAWLDGALRGGATVGFAWVAVLAFVRLATKAAVFPHPLATDEAFDVVDAWLSQPAAIVVEPTARHGQLVRSLLAGAGTGGNLVNDAHLAALSIEHRGSVISYDSDFGRLPGVTWRQPEPRPDRPVLQ